MGVFGGVLAVSGFKPPKCIRPCLISKPKMQKYAPNQWKVGDPKSPQNSVIYLHVISGRSAGVVLSIVARNTFSERSSSRR